MAGETILIADDSALSLNSTRVLLDDEGYEVVTAAGMQEALELLRGRSPDLVFADLHTPGADSLDLARLLKQDERTHRVLALAAAEPGDGQRAIDSGCDGYVARPVNAGSLAPRIRTLLDGRAGSGNAIAQLRDLRVRFLAEGRQRACDLLVLSVGQFDQVEAARAVHQWIGTGGLFGYTAISQLARETEALLKEQPIDHPRLREALTNLVLAFSSPQEARAPQLPESTRLALSGKRITAAGFSASEQKRLSAALDGVGAQATFLSAKQPPDSTDALAGDLMVIQVNAETALSVWLNPAALTRAGRPVVLAGNRDELLALPAAVQSLAREFLMGHWEPEEALVRFTLALASRPPKHAAEAASAASPPAPAQVLIADDDPVVLALIRAALQTFGMVCHQAGDGASALEAIRQTRPQAAVLDVNMPGMSGYEVLAAVRREELPVRTLLLTARQQESDILRGFTLGADDYMVKPFSPLELVARLKRLLAR